MPILLTFLLLALLIMAPRNTEAFVPEDGQLIANFIYNMVDYISWKDTNKVTICSYGHDEVSESLNNISSSHISGHEKLQNIKKIIITDNVGIRDVDSCNILYFSRFEENHVPKILDHLQNRPILTVSNIEHFVDLGGIMELKISRQKLKLRLGKDALNKTGIQLSPVILMSIKSGAEN